MIVKIDYSEVRKLNKDLAELEKNLPYLGRNIRHRLAVRTKQLMQANINSKTGRLKDSIEIIQQRKDATIIEVNAMKRGEEYGRFVEEGTDPHPQKFPKSGNYPGGRSKGDFLSQFWQRERGKRWHVKGSTRMHSGAQGTFFAQRAFDSMLRESDDMIQQEVEKYFSRRGF